MDTDTYVPFDLAAEPELTAAQEREQEAWETRQSFIEITELQRELRLRLRLSHGSAHGLMPRVVNRFAYDRADSEGHEWTIAEGWAAYRELTAQKYALYDLWNILTDDRTIVPGFPRRRAVRGFGSKAVTDAAGAQTRVR